MNVPVASSLELFTHNEQAPVKVRVEIDSDDDADWWKNLVPPGDTQTNVEPEAVKEITTYSEKTKVVEKRKIVVEEIKMYRKKTIQRKAGENAKITVPTDIKFKSIEDNTDLSITQYETPKKDELTEPEKRRKKFVKEECLRDNIPPTADSMLANIVPVFPKPQPAKTYINSAPKFKQDSSSPPPCQALNTTDHFPDPDLYINYKSNFSKAVKSCFEALKDRPDSFLEMTCEVCSISFKNNLVLLKRHLNYYHRSKYKQINIKSYISPEHVRLVVILTREPRLIDRCLRLAIEKACSIQPTDDLTILSYKCYMCHKSWEHYISFKTHMSVHLDMVIKTESSIKARHLFVHVVADAPEKALNDRNMNLPIYSATGSRIYKCFICDSYFYDKMDQHYHETNAKCLGCRKIGHCHVIKRHENSCAQFFANFFPRTCQCGQVLTSQVVVEEHQRKCSFAKSILAYHCNVCNHRTLTIDLLKAHLTNKHMVRSDAYMYQPAVQCEMCNELYAGPREQHVCTKHEYCSCSVCGQPFENSTLLACHVKAYNESAICKQCPDTLRLEKGCLMIEHEIVHHTSDRMIVHVCMICSQMYPTHLFLKLHLLTHDEESTKIVYRSKKIYPFKKDIVVEQNQCFIHKDNVPSDFAGNRKKKKNISPDTTNSDYCADVAKQIGKKKTTEEKICAGINEPTNEIDFDVGMSPSDSVEENLPENLASCKKNSRISHTTEIEVENHKGEEITINMINDNPNIVNVPTKDNIEILSEIYMIEYSGNSSERITEQNKVLVDKEIKGEDKIHNIEKNTTKDLNQLRLPENSEKAHAANNKPNNMEIVEKEIILEQNNSNIVKDENFYNQNSKDNKKYLPENSTKAIIKQNINDIAVEKIKVEQDDKILMNVEDVNLRAQFVFSINNEELSPENSEYSRDIINTQSIIEIVDKTIKTEKNTIEYIPLDENQTLNLTVLDNKSETGSTTDENIDIQECNTNVNPKITESKDTVDLMQSDEVMKHNLSTFSIKESGQANTSFNVHYQEMYSSAGTQIIVECEESECSAILENKQAKRDLNKRCMNLIRAISDDGIIDKDKTDYGIDFTENALAAPEYTPNHKNTSEIVQEDVKCVAASGATAFKLDINEEPYDDIDREDVIKEITMTEIEPEELLNDSFKKVKKKYHCTKCGFVGSYKLCKEHKESCVKIHPRLKKHQKQPKNASMLKYQIKEYSCSKCDYIFKNLTDYLSHLQLHKLQSLQCPECGIVQRSRELSAHHIGRHLRINFINIFSIYADSTKILKFFKCIKCKEVLPRGQIWQHWESHLQIGDNKKREPKAIKTVTNVTPYVQYLVEAVMIAPHREDSREILRSCKVCGRKIPWWSDMKRHFINHLSKVAQIHNGNLKCQICQHEVEFVNTYKRHMREHAGLSQYQCNWCDELFSVSTTLTKHKILCYEKYKTKKALACHLKPIKKRVTEPVASSLELFTHNEQAPVKVRVEIDSDDDADWLKDLEPPGDTQNNVEPQVMEKIKTYSKKRKL